MKHTLRSVGLAALMIAAGQANAANDTVAPANAGVISRYMAAWNAHDPEKAASYLAANVECIDASVGEAQKGREAARDNVIKVFMAAVPDLTWTMRGTPIVSKDGIAFEWTFSGTNTGAWDASTPATGKKISFDGVSYIRIKDKQIAYEGDYYDALGLHKQLGWQ